MGKEAWEAREVAGGTLSFARRVCRMRTGAGAVEEAGGGDAPLDGGGVVVRGRNLPEVLLEVAVSAFVVAASAFVTGVVLALLAGALIGCALMWWVR